MVKPSNHIMYAIAAHLAPVVHDRAVHESVGRTDRHQHPHRLFRHRVRHLHPAKQLHRDVGAVLGDQLPAMYRELQIEVEIEIEI